MSHISVYSGGTGNDEDDDRTPGDIVLPCTDNILAGEPSLELLAFIRLCYQTGIRC